MSSILQLRYFLTLAKHENLAKAAAELMISPSSLSKSVGRLEEEIGVRLFERSEKGLRLNSAGQRAMDGYTQALRILDDTNMAISDIHVNEQKTLQILSVSDLSGIDLITAFKKQYSLCPIEFNTFVSFADLDADTWNRMDFIIAGPSFLGDSSLGSQPIGDFSPVLLVPTGHPLTELGEITLADIARYPLVLSPVGTPWEQYITSTFRSAGLNLDIVDRGTHALRCQMVASGAGISISSRNGILMLPLPSGVEVLPLPKAFPQRYIYLYWNNTRYITRSMHLFQNFAARWYQQRG